MADCDAVTKLKPVSAILVSKFGALKRVKIGKKVKLQLCDNPSGSDGGGGGEGSYHCELRERREAETKRLFWRNMPAAQSSSWHVVEEEEEAAAAIRRLYPNAVKVLPPVPVLRFREEASAHEEEKSF